MKFPPLVANRPRLLLALTCLLVTGCSSSLALRFGYQNAGSLLTLRLKSYAPFSWSQRTEIENEVARYFIFHRTHLLPKYIATFRKAADQLTSTLSEKDLSALFEEGRQVGLATLEPMVQPMAKLLSQLDAYQAGELIARMEKKASESEARWANGSEEEQRQRRFERTKKNLEVLTGKLTPAQSVLMEKELSQAPLIYTAWIERRRRHQNLLAQALPTRDPQKIADAIRIRFQESVRSPSPQYDAQFARTIAKTLQALDETQRSAARERLREWADTLHKISAG